MATSFEPPQSPAALQAGFRFGGKGTHTSRTMMLAELTDVIHAVPPGSNRKAYATALVDDNVAGKQTAATRRLTNQRLGELYGLDPGLPIFRALLKAWSLDEAGHPLIALLCALARDPLLRSTASTVLSLAKGAELSRTAMIEAIRHSVDDRLNETVLDKVARNAGSTWCQSGHLKGRVRKIRQYVTPTPGSLSLALWLGSFEGLAGEQLLACRWARVLDRSARELEPVALRAKQLGLITANIGGGTAEIDASRLDTMHVEN